MKFRPQRGGFEESMKEVVELQDSVDALRHHLGCNYDDEIRFERPLFDSRNGWETYCVTVNFCAVGFTDSIPQDYSA